MMNDAGPEGDKPHEGKDHGDASDYFGVDEASLWPGVCLVEGPEVMAD